MADPTSPPRRSRWLIAVAALPAAAAIVVTALAPAPHGHWVEHLSSMGFKLTQLVVLLALAVLLGVRRLRPSLVVLLVVVMAGIALQSYGDSQVASSIWRTAGDPGFGAGYQAGHDASARGDLVVVLAGFGFAITAGATRRIGRGLAVLAAVMVIIPPPFFWPAAGVLCVMLHALTTGRSLSGPDRSMASSTSVS